MEQILARHTRYQGAIILDHHILLIKHTQHSSGRSYWVFPGGGIEPGESEEDCVRREMKEETNLEVSIDELLFDEPGHPGGLYKWRKTYLCRPVSGAASPGYEPEPTAAADYAITEVHWFDLRTEDEWGEKLVQDPITYSQMVNLRIKLGYQS
jgi:8-oxo-dGTP pyrophosphatase MutT (NUDIX family)